MIAWSANALRVLEARYLKRDERGMVVETPEGMLERVARAVAGAERAYGGDAAVREAKTAFLRLLADGRFLPNSPTLMNAGLPLGQLSACFVLPLPDDLAGIFDTVKLAALVQQSGGGTGFSASRLRPKGDVVRSSGGSASGPVAFLKILDGVTENIRQGGKRRGANMGVLAVEHPDIFEFIDAKRDGRSLRNFNLSVGVTDAFMDAVAKGTSFALKHPQTGAVVRSVDAAELFGRLADAAWKTGDPGLLFLDRMEEANPTPHLGRLEATNPCGEKPLLPYEACNLGSLNLTKFLKVGRDGLALDVPALEEATHVAVRFLDDVVDVSRWPSREIEAATRATRKIGLGVMGFAEVLLMMGVPYASSAAEALAESIARTVNDEARAASEALAEVRGAYPAASGKGASGPSLRNATRTSVAPTGTISLLAGTSSGIEPLFALAHRRRADLAATGLGGPADGVELVETNAAFVQFAKARGFWSASLEASVAKSGSLAGVSGAPADAQAICAVASEISPEWHLRIQAAFQRHVDSGVSKTINLPEATTVAEVERIYRRAYELRLKGVTVYRAGSTAGAVLTAGVGTLGADDASASLCRSAGCDVS